MMLGSLGEQLCERLSSAVMIPVERVCAEWPRVSGEEVAVAE